MKSRIKLGVNVDHVATLREARGTHYPEPITAALLAQQAGCDSIVMHLREDFRHIKERDLFLASEQLKIPLNMEMSINQWVLDYACYLKPQIATLVPERRQELTTEGGIDLLSLRNYSAIEKAVGRLQDNGIIVSLFIDPDLGQLSAAKKMKVQQVELHTGKFCDAALAKTADKEFKRIAAAAKAASDLGFFVAAGHGVNYDNAARLAKIKQIKEFNIGHAIISRAVTVGLLKAVQEMIGILNKK